MSLVGVLRVLRLPKINISPQHFAVPSSGYAAPGGGGALGKLKKFKKPVAGVQKKRLPVVTDANLLAKYVCGSNIYKEGEDIEIKPDSEYPEWLWSIRVGPAPPLEELDPNTKTYWRRLRKEALKRNNARAATRKF